MNPSVVSPANYKTAIRQKYRQAKRYANAEGHQIMICRVFPMQERHALDRTTYISAPSLDAMRPIAADLFAEHYSPVRFFDLLTGERVVLPDSFIQLMAFAPRHVPPFLAKFTSGIRMIQR